MVETVFDIVRDLEFNEFSRRIFHQQQSQNPVYSEFVKRVRDASPVGDFPFPFLPIEFFKSHQVKTFDGDSEVIFTSSGTGGEGTSKHHVKNIGQYKSSFGRTFELFYGDPADWTILALLPSYLEREGSSLVYMVDQLIGESKNEDSGFYLDDLDALAEKLITLDGQGMKVLLIGVSFALLDLVEKGPFRLSSTTIMETGGMKGRRKELTRFELHSRLKSGFGVDQIHSEYGMTELLSQAYSQEEGRFRCPPWMKVFIRQVNDPFSEAKPGKTGGINIVDLANQSSCAFIATQDLGRMHPDGSFEVLGRFDQAEVRGCNLMVV